ncbi:MAG: two-component regulator propeller domain-containing protein [bacterium]
MILRKKSLLPFLLLLTFTGFSQQYFFSDYSIEKGLSQSVVNALLQDSEGYIWVGTQNGLNKFNGYSFRVYASDPEDTTSISTNWIYSIDEDKYGDLWIGTKSGLNRYIRKENKFERITDKATSSLNISGFVYDAIVARDGKIIINMPPVLAIYDPVKKEFSHHYAKIEYDGSIKDNKIPLLEDSRGIIWIGSTRGLSCFDRAKREFTYFLPDPAKNGSIGDRNITALCEDRRDNLWVGTTAGLYLYDRKDGTFIKFAHDPGNKFSLRNNFIRAIAEDRFGNLWIGTEEGGLTRMRPYNGGQPVFEVFTNENSGLSHNIVLSLTIDHSDNLWIGTLKGMNKTDLKKQKFQLYRKGPFPYSVDLLGNVVASLYKDDKGIIWIGNWGQGLNMFDRKTWKVRHFSSRHTGNDYIPNDYVHVIFEDADNRVWIGTRDGILIWDPTRNRFIPFGSYFTDKRLHDFTGVRINMIIQDRSRNYWIGTANGLYKINLVTAASEHFTKEAEPGNRIASNLVYCLLEDRTGLVWIATGEGLDVYNPRNRDLQHYRKNSSSTNSLCDNFVVSLGEDHEGNIWIGTTSYVNKFVKKDSTFTYYSQKNGLPDNQVFEILEDDKRNLWFATGHGLCRFDSASGTFRTYSIEEGLQSLEFNLRARCKGIDGEIFFGGMNGFNSFYSDSLTDNPFVPKVVFSAFSKTNNKGVTTQLDVDTVKEVNLRYVDQSFTIEFAALEYTNPEKNRYAYRMTGISDEWIDIGNRRFVPFSNLPPGEYTFNVRCSNNDGIWNEEGRSLKIIISPPWWRSRIAYIAYFVMIILAVFLYIRRRERKLVRERDHLEQKVQERTDQIEKQNRELKELNATKDKFFSIIAHDLRNPFNTILGLSDLLLSNFKNYEQEKIRKSVSDIRDATRHTHDLLENLLIWARTQTGTLDFKPVELNLGERIAEAIDLLKGQADKKNITLQASVLVDCGVTGDKNMIDTVLRNLVTNAIKFTPKNGEVIVSMAQVGTECEISVKDNGIGIAPENTKKLFKIHGKYSRKGTDQERGSGLGLILCREFVEKHGGKIWVESTPGVGSTFKFTLPAGRK